MGQRILINLFLVFAKIVPQVIIIQVLCYRKNCYGKSYGWGIVGGRIGGWGLD